MSTSIVFAISGIILVTVNSLCTDSDGMECDYCLEQSDFTDGTYQIIESGIYCLTENIIFDPLPGDIDDPNAEGAWFPVDESTFPGSTTQIGGPFVLGFFAALTIAADDVKLDLNGYTMSFSQEFALQQRFAAIIQISNSPFIPPQGPADFGSELISGDGVEVCCGNLGFSSHHGIHSHAATNLTIHNLSIFDFEVGGIQLNGFQQVQLIDLEIGPSSQSVPATGTS